MRNLIVTAVLGLVTLSVACFGQTTFPVVVATVSRTNRTVAIQKTTIFTPTTDGVFRVTVYMINTVVATGSSAQWATTIKWSDGAGVWKKQEWFVYVANVGNSLVDAGQPPPSVTFKVKAGTPIIYWVSPIGGDPSGSEYDEYVTVEQLM